jgi:predicted DNA-binding protein (UPF0251 family)
MQMETTDLKTFLSTRNQADAAKAMGCTQGAISKMLNSGREIFVTETKAGEVEWFEIKRMKKAKKS